MKTGFGCACMLVACVAGCGPAEIRSVGVEGTVELDGKPMPEGQVEFSLAGYPPSQLEVKDGKFSGKAMPGKNRVQFAVFVANKWDPSIPESMKKDNDPGKKNILPDRFHSGSKQVVEVKGNDKFEFKVSSK